MYFVLYKELGQTFFEEFKIKKEMLKFFEEESKKHEDYFDIKKYTIIEGSKKELVVKQYAIKFDVE